MFIDADAHVDECRDTWSYIPESKSDFRPAEMGFAEGQVPRFLTTKDASGHFAGITARGLFIDGHLYTRRTRNDQLTSTTVDTRELHDVPARVQHMDELNIETQVIYPSTLLDEVTRRPEVDIVLCESYNRWLSDRCKESNGRLRWIAVLPMGSMPDALREMRRIKEDGAVGILKRGIDSDDRVAGSSYFYPMYELAQDLDLPICFHVSRPYVGYQDSLTTTEKVMKNVFFTLDAFLSLLLTRTFEKFPRLRFGFIEAGAGWLPWALFSANYNSVNEPSLVSARNSSELAAAAHHYEEVLGTDRIFVTCESEEDIPYIISKVGDNGLMVGTDYSHTDRASILYAHAWVENRSDLDQGSAKKLTETNARTFYGLS